MKQVKNKIKLVVTVVIIGFFVWFLVVYPMMVFRNNEKLLEKAARRYYELNSNELPTGERVKTLSLSTLYHKSFLEKDVYAPYTKKTCSITNSWVKVRKENDEYKYYVYLECGVLNSSIDHKGPEIKLNGEESITIGLGEKFKDPGINSVIDNNDGKLDIDSVVVGGKVDTSKVGTYEISYTAVDQLSNKTKVVREVQVVQKLYNTIKPKLNGTSNFLGDPTDNYVRLSNMLYRIYGVDNNKNVILVALEDVANVNYSKLDKWLDEYYYKHLNKDTKKLIVDTKFCNMRVSDTTLDTTQCNSYTEPRKVYIPSIVEVNKAGAGEDNFMKTYTMSWVANSKSDKEAYVTRNIFFAEYANRSFVAYNSDFNYGVRPMMVIKGDSLITGGNGERSTPYVFGDSKPRGAGSLVSELYTGEYIHSGGILWRIIDTMEDGTVKVISVDNIKGLDEDITCYPDPDKEKIVYNPKDKSSVAYFINNNVTEYVDTSKFVEHSIEVPVYKNKIIYGTETKTQKYNAVLSAPNMYEMFSAQSTQSLEISSRSYWLLNSSLANRTVGAITDIGVPLNEEVPDYYDFGVRVVGYLKKDVVVTSGKGTEEIPYKIK